MVLQAIIYLTLLNLYLILQKLTNLFSSKPKTTATSAATITQPTVTNTTATAADATAAPSGGLTLTAGGVEGSTTIDVSGTTDRGDDITL